MTIQHFIDKVCAHVLYVLNRRATRLMIQAPASAQIEPQDYFVLRTNEGRNLHIEDGVYLGPHATIYCTEAHVYIRRKAVIGPGLTIIDSDHNFHQVGTHIIDSPNRAEDAADVTIEEGAWIGANVTLLKGVTVGRGSVVAAGAVMVRSCPPYSIVGGVPARVIGQRFTADEAAEHERLLREGK